MSDALEKNLDTFKIDVLVLILFLTSLPNFSMNQVNEIVLLQRPWISTMEVIFI
jgi:hypothetical protein